MKKNLLLIAITVFQSLFMNAQEIEWIIRDGGVSYERSQSIAVDQNNNIYLTGGYNGNAQIGGQTLPKYGDEDIFISKYDCNGTPEWAISAGGPNQDLPFSIKLDSDLNIYVTGFYNQTCTFGDTTLTVPGNDQVFLAKYDNNGEYQWVRHGGSYNQNWGKSIDIDSENNIIIAGKIGADATFGDTTINGSFSMFIAKYDYNGELLFAKSGDGYSGINAVCVDNNNKIYATGDFHGELILDTIILNSNGLNSFIIALFDSNGNTQWVYDGGGSASGNGTSIIMDNNGDLCFTYLFQGSTIIEGTQYYSYGDSDLVLAKINSSGDLIWHKHIGGSNMWHDKSIAIDADNNIYITGYLIDTEYFEGIPYTALGQDVFIAKFDSSGSFKWLIQGIGESQDIGTSINFSENNNDIFSTGFFNSTLEIGGNTVITNGSIDFFLCKISLLTSIDNNKSISKNLWFPNPTLGKISSNIIDIKSVEILNQQGELISKHLNTNEVDLTNVPAGIYFIKTKSMIGIIVEKIIKQ